MSERRASRTAVLVCQGRAAAHERLATHLFTDPTAYALLRPEERSPVDQVRAGVAPDGWRPRMAYERVRACAEGMVPRTIAIDEAVLEVGAAQVVILGAGLDGRAWRMPSLGKVYEVDHPASQRDKRERCRALPGRAPVYVPVDLAHDDLGPALGAAGHRPSLPTTWVWEGVIPYLRRDAVVATMGMITKASGPGSRLVLNYQSPSLRARVGRLVVGVLSAVTGERDPLADEPWRSLWTRDELGAVAERGGFLVARDDDLLSIARERGLRVRATTSLETGRVLVADM